MRVVGGRLARARARRSEIAGDPADRRPAARVAVQYSPARLRRSHQRRARARSLCRHRRARHRSASRGAAFALFIDESAEARALLRENVAALGLGGASRIFRRDATKLGPAHPLAPFSLVFLDPPYGAGPCRAGACRGARRRLVRARRAHCRRGGGRSPLSPRPKVLPRSSGAATTIPSSFSCGRSNK